MRERYEIVVSAAEAARAAVDDFAETLRSVGDIRMSYDPDEIVAKPTMSIWSGDSWVPVSGVRDVKVAYGTHPRIEWIDKIAPLESIQ